MEHDLSSFLQTVVALEIQTIASDTTTDGEAINTTRYESLVYSVQMGALEDGDYAVNLQHAEDDGNGSPATWEDLAADDLIGDLPVFDADTDDHRVMRVGSKSKRPWQRLQIVSTNFASAGAVIGAQAILGHPRYAPQAQLAT